MGIATLLAEELDRKTDLDLVESHINNEDDDDDGPSLKLEKWLRQFELFTNFIEEINDCFGNILALTLFRSFVKASDLLFPIAKQLSQGKHFKYIYAFYLLDLFFICYRLLIFVIVSYRLQHKVYKLFFNCLNYFNCQ